MRTLILESQYSYVIYYIPFGRALSCIRDGFTSIDVNYINRYIAGAKHDAQTKYAVEIIFDRNKLIKLLTEHENYLKDSSINPSDALADLCLAIDYVNILTDIDRDSVTDDMVAEMYPRIRKQIVSKKEQFSKNKKEGKGEVYQTPEGSVVPNKVTRLTKNSSASTSSDVSPEVSSLSKNSKDISKIGTAAGYGAAVGAIGAIGGAIANVKPFTNPSGSRIMPSNLTISQKGLDFIKGKEGFRSTPYPDAGKTSIGYGTTVPPGKFTSITKEQAEAMLRSRIGSFERVLRKYVKVPVTQNQWDALVSLIYNIGSGNFSESTLLRKLNANDIKGAADEFLRWNRSEGVFREGLYARREEEREIFIS